MKPLSTSLASEIISSLTVKGIASCEAVNYYDIATNSEVFDRINTVLRRFNVNDSDSKIRNQMLRVKEFLNRFFDEKHIDFQELSNCHSHNADWAFDISSDNQLTRQTKMKSTKIQMRHIYLTKRAIQWSV